MSSGPGRLFEWVVDHNRLVIAAVLVLTVVVGMGMPNVEQSQSLQQFESDSTAADKRDYVESNFSSARPDTVVAQVVVEGEDVLSKDVLIRSLELQQQLRSNETVADTLPDERPTVGIANVVARTVIARQSGASGATFEGGDAPSLERQVEALESMDESQVNETVSAVLSDSGDRGGGQQAQAFMPSSYEPGSTSAGTTMIAVFQTEEVETAPTQKSDRIVESQQAVAGVVEEFDVGDRAFAVGTGLISAEMQQSRQDSMSIVGPLALLFVLTTLALAYRDLLDIVLGLVGIAVVLVWTFGFMGWAGIDFNSAFIAVPVLLVGLSVDYAIHVVMRYREEYADGDDPSRDAMRRGLAGVGVALLWVTLTTVIGFLSNLVSSVPPVRDIGLMSAFGIASTLVVFCGLIPALKVELDSLLSGVGLNRRKRPIGANSSLSRVMSVGAVAARKAPVAVLLVGLVVTAGGAYGATQVDTSFDPQDFFADDPPAWTDELPGKLQPGEYTAKDNLDYVNERYVRHDARAEILVEGDVTDPKTLDQLDAATERAGEADASVTLPDGGPHVVSVLSVMDSVAARNETFNATVAAADTDGDGVPDRNVDGVYDELYAAAPDSASRVLHRTDGGYEATRMSVYVNGDAASDAVTAQMGSVADVVDAEELEATATGQHVVRSAVQDRLVETVLVSLVLTLVSVLALLAFVYRLDHGSATLGIVTLLPVVLSVAWILGSMYALGIPLSVLTAMVTSLTIGIGVDYNIHVSQRFVEELEKVGSPYEALHRTITSTGTALFGSAVTTVGGFGVLAFAILPMLQQFGIITALTIVYAFLASLLLLPTLLVLWSRYAGWDDAPESSSAPSSAVSEGGLD